MQRVIIPIVGQGSVIHIIRTGLLEQLRETIKPIIAISWDQPDLVEELKLKGYTVTLIPKYEVSNEYLQVRNKINLWYSKYQLKSPTTKILRGYLDLYLSKKKVAKRKLKHIWQYLLFAINSNYIKSLKRYESVLIKQQPAYKNYKEWLDILNIDSVFMVTPFLQEIELIGRVLKDKGARVIASIHSFDNITTRQWPAFFFDHYIVWNHINKAELERIAPELKKNNAITVCGPPQFDFHYKEGFIWSKEEWLVKLGLPNDKKIILYAGGPYSLFKDEPQYLQHLNEAFKEGKINSNDAIILFRSHPLDKKERWFEFVGESSNIIYDAAQSGKQKFDYTNVVEDDLQKLISTICYADVQINFTSTMTIDGSVFHKPQIGPYYTEIKKEKREYLTRKMYYQEHYLPITESKAINRPSSKEAFIEMVNEALYHPEKYTQYCNDCLQTMIVYTDGKSTDRVVAAIKKFFAR
jgi:hypothetical protein